MGRVPSPWASDTLQSPEGGEVAGWPGTVTCLGVPPTTASGEDTPIPTLLRSGLRRGWDQCPTPRARPLRVRAQRGVPEGVRFAEAPEGRDGQRRRRPLHSGSQVSGTQGSAPPNSEAQDPASTTCVLAPSAHTSLGWGWKRFNKLITLHLGLSEAWRLETWGPPAPRSGGRFLSWQVGQASMATPGGQQQDSLAQPLRGADSTLRVTREGTQAWGAQHRKLRSQPSTADHAQGTQHGRLLPPAPRPGAQHDLCPSSRGQVPRDQAGIPTGDPPSLPPGQPASPFRKRMGNV